MHPRAADEGSSSGGPPERSFVSEKSSSLTEFDKAKMSRKLSRMHSIVDTPSLVKAYNDEPEKTKQQILAEWIYRYREIQDKSQISDAIRELAELTKIKPRADQDLSLLRFIFGEIRDRLKPRGYPEKNVGKALYEALLWTHPDHFLNESLTKMTQNVLSSLSSSPQMYNTIFEDYEATFLSLRQAIVRLRDLSHAEVSWTDWQALRKTVKEKRQTLMSSFKYYPVSFHFNIIEKGIECLDVTDLPFVAQLLNCASCDSCSLMKLVRGSSSSNAHGDASFSRRGMGANSAQWYQLYCELEDARLKTLRNKTDAVKFLRKYDELKKRQETIVKGESRTALRFGIIHELCQLSLHGTDDVRQETTMKLLELSSTDVRNNDWINERVIFEALLEAVYRVHKKGNLRRETAEALREMTKMESPLQQEVVVEWLGSVTVEDKLRMQDDEMTATWQRNLLFNAIARQVGYIPFAVIRKNIEGLKKAYTSDSFTTVQPVFDRESYAQINDMQHYIVHYDKIEDHGEDGQPRCAAHENHHATEDYDRRERPHREIALEDLFGDRKPESGGRSAERRKVLLYGNPGSGKTCIGKVIGYKWANNRFKDDVDVVYVVPVIKLNSSNLERQEWKTLAEAVTNICYSHQNKPITDNLLTQVDDDLDDLRTLLVLDGVDEGDEKGKDMITLAKKRQCKILMLSRPYNLFDEKAFTELEVECLGFREEQLKAYINKELPKEGKKLIERAKKEKDMWRSMHNPVKACIVCLLWKEGEPALVDEDRKTSDFAMYGRISNFMWSRFAKRPNMGEVSRDDIFQRLESIAFEAFRKKTTLVNQTLVEEHASTAFIREILRDSGFLLYNIEKMQYQFPHKHVQEYFVGRYVARTLEGETVKDQTSVAFLTNGKYTADNRDVISFMTQAIAQSRRGIGLQKLFSFIDQEPREIIGVRHFLLKLCLLDKFLAGLWRSEIDETTSNDAASQIIHTLTLIIKELKPGNDLWNIIITKLREYPNVLRQYHDEVIGALTEESKLQEVVDADCFEDIVMLTIFCPRHTADLVDAAREKLEDQSNPRIRLAGLCMVRDILGHHQDRARDLVPMLRKGCEDSERDNRRMTMFFVRRVCALTHNVSGGLLEVLKSGFQDEDASVRIAAMMTVKCLAVHIEGVSEELFSLIKEGCKSTNKDMQIIALRTLGYLRSEDKDPKKFDELIEEAEKNEDEKVKSAAESSKKPKDKKRMCECKEETKDLSDDTQKMIENLCKKEKTKPREASTVNDLTDLWQKAVEAEKEFDVGELVPHLIQLPVTVEQTSKKQQQKPVVHTDGSDAMQLCDRNTVNNLITAIEERFEKMYPGILNLLR